MGQTTVAIMYGVNDVKGVELFGEDETGGLVDLYRAHLGSGFDDDRLPKRPYESELPAIGYHVAIGGSGKEGIPDLYHFAWLDMGKIYKSRISVVKKHWAAFAKWAKKKQGVELPEPQFFLTEDEVV